MRFAAKRWWRCSATFEQPPSWDLHTCNLARGHEGDEHECGCGVRWPRLEAEWDVT